VVARARNLEIELLTPVTTLSSLSQFHWLAVRLRGTMDLLAREPITTRSQSIFAKGTTLMKRAMLVTLVVLALLGVAMKANVQKASYDNQNESRRKEEGRKEDLGDAEKVPPERWEYLAVAGPTTTNFSGGGDPSMRKEGGKFAREAFVLEQHLDHLGSKGWELVSVAGPPTDPVYYFKRRK